jgi:FAD/FMN-containing dehydrogenase
VPRRVVKYDRSISAEHGIGETRHNDFLRYTPANKIQLMCQLKQAIDPTNLMNPGKML